MAVLLGLGIHTWLVFYLHSIKPPKNEEILHISQGEIADNQVESWQSVALPDQWLDSRPQSKEGWYRFAVDLPQGARGMTAIYLPVVMQNVAVYVNGEPVGDGGRFESPIARNYPLPLLFPVSPELLKEGRNEIVVYLATEPAGVGLLPGFYLGPRETLVEVFDFRQALKSTAPLSFVVIMLILAVMLATITLRQPKETVYAWFAAILVALAAYTLSNLVVEIPVSTRIWDWFRMTNIGWVILFITIFTHRFIEIRRTRIELAMTALILAGVIVVALVPSQTYYQWAGTLWVGLCMSLGAYPAFTLGARVIRERRFDNLLLLTAGLTLMVLGAHDAAVVARLVPRTNGYLMPYATPTVAVIFTWILMSQFINARREAEALNIDLENRVAEKAAALEAEHARRQQLEAERAVAQERERLMRDMHDGVGGHLASAVSLLDRESAEPDKVSEVLRQAAEDLRLIIHSLEPTDEDLGTVLGLLRPRLQRQTELAGIELDWQVEDTPDVPGLGPDMALQIMRIVQEAVTNTIKHSGSERITLRSYERNGQICIEIADNGRGMSDTAGDGYGLGNMRERADNIGATLEIADNKPGTVVILCLPLLP